MYCNIQSEIILVQIESWPTSKFPLEVKTIGGFLFVFLGDLLKSYTCQCRFQSYETLPNEIKSPSQIGEGRYKNCDHCPTKSQHPQAK
jgi:hypothetical protein